MIDIACEDCMGLMARYPDGHFDLALVDPPYGIGEEWKKNYWREFKRNILTASLSLQFSFQEPSLRPFISSKLSGLLSGSN